MYHLATLGRLALREDDSDGSTVVSSCKPLLVLAYLCATTEREERRERVASLFWPDADDDGRARQSLRQALYSLRRKVDDTLVDGRDDGRLVVVDDRLEVDLWALDRATEEERFRDVVRLYRGPFLAEFRGRIGGELESWMEVEDERLRTAVRAALHRLTTDALEEERVAEAVRWSGRLVEMNPLLESAQLVRVRALAAAGRPTDALQAYETYRALLREALGDRPGRELREEADRVRAAVFRVPDVPSPATDVPSPATDVPPSATGEVAATEEDGRPAKEAGAEAGASEAPERPRGDEGRPDGGGGRRSGAAARPTGGGGSLSSAAWGGVVGGLLVLLVVSVAGRAIGGADAGADAPARAPVLVVPAEGPDEWHELRTDGDDARLRPTGVRRGALPSPDGSLVAVRARGDRGMDVELVDVATGERRLLFQRPHDEFPESWSPDGRSLLIRSGEPDEEVGAYTHRPWIVDVESGEARALRLEGLPDRASLQDGVDWSPRGVRLVFAARSEDSVGDEDLYVTTVAGRRAERLTSGPAQDRWPSWAPDGRRIAFSSDRSGSEGIYLLDVRTGRVRLLVDDGWDETRPVWVSPDEVAYLRRDDAGADLWMVEVSTGRRWAVTEGRALDRGLARPARPAGALAPVEAVEARPAPGRVSPGQWLTFEPRATDAAGALVPSSEVPWRWETSDSTVVAFREPGVARVAIAGEAEVVVSAGGWRADTLRIRSATPEVRERPQLLEEDWTAGVAPERWHPMGDPPPSVVRRPGPSGDTIPVFLNDGDEHYDSGVQSVRAFSLDRGLTVEVWGRAPLERAHYQAFRLSLESEPGEPGTSTWSHPGNLGNVELTGRPAGRRLIVAGPSARGTLPLPEGTDEWHRYAIQIDSAGTHRVLRDGRVLWQDPRPVNVAAVDSVWVALGDRSLDTEIFHGPLRVWRGARYVFPGE